MCLWFTANSNAQGENRQEVREGEGERREEDGEGKGKRRKNMLV